MSWLQRLNQACAELSERGADPWRRVLERDLPANVTSISTVALLDLLDVPQTTGNARRLAKTMRSMGWVGLKSRRLEPGGFRHHNPRLDTSRSRKGINCNDEANNYRRSQLRTSDHMKYLLQKYSDDRYDLANDDSDSLVACVCALRPGEGGPGYRVQILVPDTDDEYPEFAIKSIDEAIPAVAAYYEAHPPRWEPESDCSPRYAEMGSCRARYIKQTQFGQLWVDQIESGQWVAYRDGQSC